MPEQKVYSVIVPLNDLTRDNVKTIDIGGVFKGNQRPYMLISRTFNPAGVQLDNGREEIFIRLKTSDDEPYYCPTANDKKYFDAIVATGDYISKSGEQKSNWENVGAVYRGSGGFYMWMYRYFNPAGVTVRDGSRSILVTLVKPHEG